MAVLEVLGLIVVFFVLYLGLTRLARYRAEETGHHHFTRDDVWNEDDEPDPNDMLDPTSAYHQYHKSKSSSTKES